MAEITDFPVIQPTPEEKAAYEQQFGAPPLNPIRDLTAPELADLASADKENFEIVSAFRANKDLWADPAIVSKVADAHNLIRQRGFSLSDLPTPKRAATLALDVAKGFGKQLWNYGAAGVETAMGIGADLTGQEGIARELEQQAQRRVAENIAGSEQALFGLADMGVRAAQKTGRALGIAKPLTAQTPQEKIADLWTAVGTGETQEDIARGHGGFMTPVGGEVIAELEASGKPVRPEETAALAAGDPFSFYLFGKGFQAAGAATRAVTPTAVQAGLSRAGEKIATGAEKAAGAGIQALGKLTELGGRAAEITGKVAPVAAAAGAAVSGEPISALAILGGGTAAGRTLQAAGRRTTAGGQLIVEAGKQVGGKPVVSPLAQMAKDVAFATPGAIGEIVSGTAADLGLAAVSAETPQQTESAVGIGTVLGAAGGAKRIAGRVISGQLIAPREYGIEINVPSSGQFPRFDQMHSAAYSAAPPGVRARLNAVRQFASGAKVDSDVFMAPDAPTLERALIDSGVEATTAKTFSEQEGFFTTSLLDKNGQPRRVIVVKNVEAAPHESFHPFQDVLGEAANRELDSLVRQEYSDRWDAEGTRYAKRLVGDLGNRAWEEVILDESGWGLDAAKEKIFREVYNRLEAETGAAPTDAQVRDLADPELVRIFNEAQSRNPNARPEQFWREVLSPEEAKSEADRYAARELAAENWDAVFKHLGPSLEPGTALPQRMARIAGNIISMLGGEPLAGRRTEIGQIEPRFRVTERITELARGDTQPVAQPPTRPTPVVPPRGTLPSTPEGRQQVVDEARSIAEQAPDKPLAGGIRSPRELLGQIAEAIAQQAGVKINYLSAPGEPAAATTSNRETRRAVIEFARTAPASARSLWEKSFFPERVRKTSKGFQVEGWAPEVFAANAHKLANFLSSIPEGQKYIPYSLDTTTKSLTEGAWKELFDDTQNFVRNQIVGQTGAGEPLVVPRELTDRGFFAPQSTPSRAVGLEQSRADTINMLFNFRLPDTPRVTAGKLPLNIAGQEISIATARGPQRLSVPVEPRAPFSGEAAGALGIEGRSILEVNPVRSAIEQAASQAKAEMPSFIEAIQKLNLENIKEVELAPELPQFRGNTLTLTAGFQPSAEPRAIKAAAVRDEQGRIYEGSWHGEAVDVANASGAKTLDERDFGFVTNEGEYLTRAQAFDRARELNQIAAKDEQEFLSHLPLNQRVEGQGVLEAEGFNAVRQFQPVAESARRLTEMTPEEWKGTIGNYKGKLGAGLTGWAWDLGASAKTFDDVQALRSASEALREASKSGDFTQRMELIGRAQAAREAYEAATGRNLEDTNDGSAVPGIRKYVDPNYNPPVPLGNDPVQAILSAHKANGGATFNLFQNKNIAGEPVFAVSAHPERSKIINGELTAKDLSEYIRANEELLADPTNSVGTWSNEGQTYLDIVVTEPDRARAVQLGRDNNQIAIFDLQNRTEIPTGGTGEPAAQFQPKDKLVKSATPEDPTNVLSYIKRQFWLSPEGKLYDAGLGQIMQHDSWAREHIIGETAISKLISTLPAATLRDLGPALASREAQKRGWSQLFLEPDGRDKGIYVEGRLNKSQRQTLEDVVFHTQLPAIDRLTDATIFEKPTQPTTGQFQPEAGEAPEFKLRKPTAGGMFSKAWILPDGSPVQLGGKWHHEFLSENPDVMERFGVASPDPADRRDNFIADSDSRIEALKRGFARLNYARNGGQLTVEARAADWAKLRPSVQQFVETNIDQIDNLRVELFNDDVSAVADSGSARFMDLNSDMEKMAAIPFLESTPASGAVGGAVTGIAQARSRQFQPGAEEQQQQPELAGMPAGARPMLTTSQLASMSRKELMDHFPEAIVPKRSADTIPSKLREAPLVKDVDDPVQTYADKLAEFGRSVENTPEYQMGRKWYSEFSEQLKARFGSDARVFAELLAATSPQTSVESNFKFALDALEGFKSGRFKQNIKKFEQGLSLIANEKWLSWYNRELNAGRISDPPAKPTPAAFMARWIAAHDIKPRQSNGKLFGINSIPVLQVAARKWLEQNKGPKVKNFVENLLGEGTEATIDLWADRTLRRLGYSDFQERWRIMPVNKQGVSDEDFAFAQSIFRNAAQQLGMKPSELQAAVWFAEKQLWADNGWSRLDLGDFREQLKKTEQLRAEIRGRETAAESTPDLLSVEPRGRVSAVKSQAQPAAEHYVVMENPSRSVLFKFKESVGPVSESQAEFLAKKFLKLSAGRGEYHNRQTVTTSKPEDVLVLPADEWIKSQRSPSLREEWADLTK